MKVLVFPALLAIAIFTTPPKPFAPVPVSKNSPATAMAAKPGSAPLEVANNQPHVAQASKEAAGLLTPEKNVTARR